MSRRRKRIARRAAQPDPLQCNQIGCTRPAELNGVCMPCWSAIFG